MPPARSGRACSRRPRRDRQRDLALSSSCRGKSGAVLRGRCPAPLAGVVWAATGEVSLSVQGAKGARHGSEQRAPPPRPRKLVRVAKPCPGSRWATTGQLKLIGARRRVKARVRALAALNQQTLAPGRQAAFLGKAGPRATQPGRIPGCRGIRFPVGSDVNT